MLKRWCLYLAAVLGVLVLYLAYQQWLAWIVLLWLLALPLFSVVVSLPAMLTVRGKLINRGAMPYGTEGVLQVQLSCRLPVPPHRGGVRVEHSLTGERMTLESGDDLPTEHCGCLTLTPKKCRVYDYFGLFHAKIRHMEPTKLLLRPVKAKCKAPADLQRYLSRNFRPKPGGGYAEHHELRLYRPGDNLNQVHWKLSAKVDDLMIREAMVPARDRVLLTMDLKGTPEELDLAFGRLLFYGELLLEHEMQYELHVLTAAGRVHWNIALPPELHNAVDALLQMSPAGEGSIADLPVFAAWRHHITGTAEE